MKKNMRIINSTNLKIIIAAVFFIFQAAFWLTLAIIKEVIPLLHWTQFGLEIICIVIYILISLKYIDIK